MSEKSLHECVVLHVEDDDPSAYLFELALREADLHPRLCRVSSASEADAFLSKRSPYEDVPRPDLILLDLNLPGENGFSVLDKVKATPVLRDIEVVVFTSSESPIDQARARELGADDYLSKGLSFDAFAAAARAVCEKVTTQRRELSDSAVPVTHSETTSKTIAD